MSPSDVNLWRSKIIMEHKDGVAVKELLEYLYHKRLHIGPKTIESGFIQCLHQACLVGAFRFVEYTLQTYIEHINLNRTNLIHPTRYFASPEEASPTEKAKHRKETLLHAVAISNSVDILKLMLTFDVHIDAVNCCLKTPLIVALEERNRDIAAILLDHGANVNLCDNESLTPLMYAARIPAMISLIPHMICLGANLAATDSRGYTALHIAVAEGTPGAALSLYNKDVATIPTSMPHPSYLADQSNFLQQDFHHFKRIKEFRRTFKSSRNFPITCVIDLHLLEASWYFYVHSRLNPSPDDLVKCKHALFEAMTKGSVFDTVDELSSIYNGQKEIQNLEDVKSMFEMSVDEFDLHLALAYQSLLVRERCLGYGDPTVIYCLFSFGTWLVKRPIEMNRSAEGLKLWLRGTDMILHHVQHTKFISSHILHLVINGLRLLSITLQQDSSSNKCRVILFGEYLCNHILTPVVNNLIKCVCRCVELTKSRHTHLVTRKSFISGLQSLLELLNDFLLIKPDGLNIECFIQVLLENCPKIIIDANGFSSTLVHILLQLDSIKFPEKILLLLLKNNGHWMVNGVGPLGTRPLQMTYREEVITLLIEYGAHLDAVNSSKRTVIKDLHTRRPDLFPEPWVDSEPFPLKCLSATVIASHGLPYTQLRIPPGIKRFISLHDYKAQETLLEDELDFVFTN